MRKKIFNIIRRREFSGPTGVHTITLIKNRPILVLLREAKPLKMQMPTIGGSPWFCCKSD